MKRSRLHSFYADYAGIIAAMVCLIHCLAAPLLLGAAAHSHATLEGHAHHHADAPWYLHRAWDFVFLGIGLVAVWYSTRHSHQRWMKRLLWGTFGALAFSVLLEAQGEWFRYLVYAASLVLVSAHLLQLRQVSRRPVKADSRTSRLPEPETMQVLGR